MNGPDNTLRAESGLIRLLNHPRGQLVLALVAFGLIVVLSASPYLLRPYDGIGYSVYGGIVS